MLRIKTKYLFVIVCFITLNKLFSQEVVSDIALSKKLDETSALEIVSNTPVSYTHLTLPTTPYV